MMVLNVGDKVHVVERRYFEEDIRRHFVGEVIAYSDHALRVKGHVWVLDKLTREFVRRPEERERVIFPGDRLIVNIIPNDTNLDEIKYVSLPQKGIVVTDGKKYTLDLSEFLDVGDFTIVHK